MPLIKEKFGLKYDDVNKLKNAIIKFQGDKEKTINDCLQKITAPKVIKSVTEFLPIAKNKYYSFYPHAVDAEWYEVTYYNLSFVLANNLKGKNISKTTQNKGSRKSFYYLYYPATGTGNSYKKGPNDFLNDGINKVYDSVVEDLLIALNEKIEEGFTDE